MQGRDLVKGEFEFVLEIDGEVVEKVKNDADGKITFSQLTFDEAGEHTFKIYEVKGDAANVTYDSTVFEGKITITDNGEGSLEAKVEGADNIVFTNKYEKPEELPTPPTGDHTNMVIWMMIMMAVGLELASVIYVKKRQTR